MKLCLYHRSGALAALLLCALLFAPACALHSGEAGKEDAAPRQNAGTAPQGGSAADTGNAASGTSAARDGSGERAGSGEDAGAEAGAPQNGNAENGEPAGSSREAGSTGFPEYRDFFSEGDPDTAADLTSSNSSAGTIGSVEPFNFGRDPGGPEDKTLQLTIPKVGLYDVPVFDTVSEEKLVDGAVHIPATGYPWQKGANVYIAGHRIGYPNTRSYYVFFRLDELNRGDEIELEDSAGGRYRYRVTRRLIVGPDSVEVMNAVEDTSLISLQTCTLPDYKNRLVVQGELVEKQV